MKLGKREMNIIRIIGETQLNLLNTIEETEDIDKAMESMVKFEYDGMIIVNPFVDESGMFEVDPIKYYGRDFLRSDFVNLFR